MPLPPTRDDRLLVLVFGPGTGELILVRAPGDRWLVIDGCSKEPGEAPVRAAHPASVQVISPAVRASAPNERATALLVEWESVRLVLGADLEPAASWRATLSAYPRTSHHQGLKVAHHGSFTAQEPSLFDRSHTAPRVITPFASKELPRFDDGGGVALHHVSAPEVHLTSLPRPHALQGGAGATRLRRSALASHPETTMDPPVTGFPDCFVAIEWDSTGQPTLHHGPGSVILLR